MFMWEKWYIFHLIELKLKLFNFHLFPFKFHAIFYISFKF